MWCVQVNFLTRHRQLFYVLDTHESSINAVLLFSCLVYAFALYLSLCSVYVCMHVCMINSIRTRSRRVISCNNTSRRAHISLLHEPINDDDDDNGHIWLVVIVEEKENARKKEKSRLAKKKKSKSCQMTVAKGQNRSILVRLWSVDKCKQLSALTTTKQQWMEREREKMMRSIYFL